MNEVSAIAQTNPRKIIEEGMKTIEEITISARESFNKIMNSIDINAIRKEANEFCEMITKPEEDFKTPFNLDEGDFIDEDYTTYNENDIMSFYD